MSQQCVCVAHNKLNVQQFWKYLPQVKHCTPRAAVHFVGYSSSLLFSLSLIFISSPLPTTNTTAHKRPSLSPWIKFVRCDCWWYAVAFVHASTFSAATDSSPTAWTHSSVSRVVCCLQRRYGGLNFCSPILTFLKTVVTFDFHSCSTMLRRRRCSVVAVGNCCVAERV